MATFRSLLRAESIYEDYVFYSMEQFFIMCLTESLRALRRFNESRLHFSSIDAIVD